VGADGLPSGRLIRAGVGVREARLSLALLMVALLLFTLGLVPGAQTSSEEAKRQARYVPEVSELLSKPTVEASADYDGVRDLWRVVLREQVSDSAVARLTVDDDSGEVSGVEISPMADTLTYPNLSEEEATKLALAESRVQEELSRHSGYTTDAEYEDGEWTVHFRTTDTGDGEEREVARVGVDDESWASEYVYTGDQVGWQMARGESGAYGKHANYWYVWGPLALVFALAFIRTDRLFSLRNLDVAALLGFLVSHGYFREGISYEAVLLWYPPLLYLFLRALLMGFGIGERVERTSNFPAWLLFALAALAGGLVLGLNLDSRVIDVGYAGVVGADRILDGTLPYGNMPDDVGTGDTYGPLNYLLYVPFVLIFGFTGEWGYLPAAHAVTIFAFVAGALAMMLAGWRLAGPRGAAALVFAWAVFPYTLYSTNNNTNDVIVASIATIGLAAATSPFGRGAAVAAGFAVKLFPLALGPLWMLHNGPGIRPIARFLLGGAVVVLGSFWILTLDGDLAGGAKLFFERTLAFQGERETPWTIFTQVPELRPLQQPLTAAVILLGFIVAIYPKKRTVRRLAAFSAALVIAVQLTVNYWFYPYITWFEPFVFVALLLATNEKTPLDGETAGDGLKAEKRPIADQPA
jgi:hypothetical protein